MDERKLIIMVRSAERKSAESAGEVTCCKTHRNRTFRTDIQEHKTGGCLWTLASFHHDVITERKTVHKEGHSVAERQTFGSKEVKLVLPATAEEAACACGKEIAALLTGVGSSFVEAESRGPKGLPFDCLLFTTDKKNGG